MVYVHFKQPIVADVAIQPVLSTPTMLYGDERVEWMGPDSEKYHMIRVDIDRIFFIKDTTSTQFDTKEDVIDIADTFTADSEKVLRCPFTHIVCMHVSGEDGKFVALNTRRLLAMHYYAANNGGGFKVDILIGNHMNTYGRPIYSTVKLEDYVGERFTIGKPVELEGSKFIKYGNVASANRLAAQDDRLPLLRWLTLVLLNRKFTLPDRVTKWSDDGESSMVELDSVSGNIIRYIRRHDAVHDDAVHIRKVTTIVMNGSHAYDSASAASSDEEYLECVGTEANIIDLFFSQNDKDKYTRNALYYTLLRNFTFDVPTVDLSCLDAFARSYLKVAKPLIWLPGRFYELATSVDKSFALVKAALTYLEKNGQATELSNMSVEGDCKIADDPIQIMRNANDLFDEKTGQVLVDSVSLAGLWGEYYWVVVRTFLIFLENDSLTRMRQLLYCIGCVNLDKTHHFKRNINLIKKAIFDGACTLKMECPIIRNRARELKLFRIVGMDVMDRIMVAGVKFHPSLKSKVNVTLLQYFKLLD